MRFLGQRTSRRRFLAGALTAFGSASLGFRLGIGRRQFAAAQTAPSACGADVRHLSWVWQFSSDSSPKEIAPVLAAHNLGVTLKTHDGSEWMAKYDTSPQAVSGPEQVSLLARYFESYGVPFHAWAVVKGVEPKREAAMCADVLAVGARSITLDLEPWRGFWQGTREDALTFGQELRQRQPWAVVKTAVDPRPWVISQVPLAEFVSFSNALMPLIYWESFATADNIEKFAASGSPPTGGAVTPEFLLNVTTTILQGYNLPIEPTGQGASRDMDAWRRFVDHASQLGMKSVSVWRHGVTDPQVWRLLKEKSPVGESYLVQPGDTLSALAQQWGVGVDDIVQANNIADPSLIYVGQELCIPGR